MWITLLACTRCDPAEDPAAADRAFDRDHSRVVVVGRVLSQALVRPVDVVVLGELGEHRPGVPPTKALRVRQDYLSATALRAEAFAALASKKSLIEVEERLARAAAVTEVALLEGREADVDDVDAGPVTTSRRLEASYGFAVWWRHVVRMTRLMLDGDTKGARAAYAIAAKHLPDALPILSARGGNFGPWQDAEDFAREPQLVTCVELLSKGPRDVYAAERLLSDWCKASRATMGNTVRFHRAEVRRLALGLLVAKLDGLPNDSVKRRKMELVSARGRWPGVGIATEDFATVVIEVISGQSTFTEAQGRLLRLFHFTLVKAFSGPQVLALPIAESIGTTCRNGTRITCKQPAELSRPRVPASSLTRISGPLLISHGKSTWTPLSKNDVCSPSCLALRHFDGDNSRIARRACWPRPRQRMAWTVRCCLTSPNTSGPRGARSKQRGAR